ncbi:hypothetical protein CBR_g15981 [Chara braunii]|uniref:Methyltransferase type 11 domain-containing protein n=1 Tax=Chara braunii TaxID=69332 RepID=A0A388JSU7_CHABU|nr:hypothetical protein CBR_g15981 [Chara braunii]|eukprot:GBG60860.1 hypothetical protein CBR_g15981 [Chara braunii]
MDEVTVRRSMTGSRSGDETAIEDEDHPTCPDCISRDRAPDMDKRDTDRRSTEEDAVSGDEKGRACPCATCCTPQCDMCHTEDSARSSRREEAAELQPLITPPIERKYVHRVYDTIAPHFSSTRFAKWPKVAQFLESLPVGSILADSGCGNGKYLGFNQGVFHLASDISPRLVKICSSRGYDVAIADSLCLPYRDDVCDGAICIAVLHHMSTEARRRQAILELVRVLKPGGKALITVWALEQEDPGLISKWTPLIKEEQWLESNPEVVHHRQYLAGSDVRHRSERPVIAGSHCDKKPAEEATAAGRERSPRREHETLQRGSHDKQQGRDEKDGKEGECETEDMTRSNGQRSGGLGGEAKPVEYFVPWHLPYHRAEIASALSMGEEESLGRRNDKKGAVVYDRYYHLFVKGELESLVRQVPEATVVDSFFDKSNCCIHQLDEYQSVVKSVADLAGAKGGPAAYRVHKMDQVHMPTYQVHKVDQVQTPVEEEKAKLMQKWGFSRGVLGGRYTC